jgi:rubredoxin
LIYPETGHNRPISKCNTSQQVYILKVADEMTSKQPKTWFSIINESVHTSDDIDIGDIEAINRNFVVIKRGFLSVHYYYIPVNRIEGWDGKVLWLKLTESQVKENYERDLEPDPFIYFVKEHKEFFMPLTVPVIPPKGPKSREKEVPEENIPDKYRCPLCNEVFDNEDGLTKHVELVGH